MPSRSNRRKKSAMASMTPEECGEARMSLIPKPSSIGTISARSCPPSIILSGRSSTRFSARKGSVSSENELPHKLPRLEGRAEAIAEALVKMERGLVFRVGLEADGAALSLPRRRMEMGHEKTAGAAPAPTRFDIDPKARDREPRIEAAQHAITTQPLAREETGIKVLALMGGDPRGVRAGKGMGVKEAGARVGHDPGKEIGEACRIAGAQTRHPPSRSAFLNDGSPICARRHRGDPWRGGDRRRADRIWRWSPASDLAGNRRGSGH